MRRRWWTLVLSLGCACAPSAFDDLGRSRSPSTCDKQDAGFDAEACHPDSGAGHEPDAKLDAAQPDTGAEDASSCPACHHDADASTCVQAASCPGEPADMCATEPACKPGEREDQERACGACDTGKQTRARQCTETCTWGAWSTWSACSGVTAPCSPGDTTACANGDSCGHRVCTEQCRWSECVPIDPNGCLRIGKDHTEEGTNYRCCGVGMWQFCLPNCRWSTACVACSEGAPNFCTDCYP